MRSACLKKKAVVFEICSCDGRRRRSCLVCVLDVRLALSVSSVGDICCERVSDVCFVETCVVLSGCHIFRAIFFKKKESSFDLFAVA